ncbi:hypothetical protein [Metasolibacillus fluoroglycofenilyticus]|uniref:hypothetical protein n=1 Tax=Metasolibacillus fluoroglycofenilyticus TaxID=1239396 RepID=UPI0012903D51|nr:hypothetical protein [Metasolibacillus fluoroglycofenilyticus]
MMYFSNVSLIRNIGAQVKWRLETYSNVVMIFVLIQLFISVVAGNSGMSGSGMNNLMIKEYFYSLDGLLGISMMTAFTICAIFASERIQKDNLAVPTTRLATNISVILFICIVLFIATVTAIMTNNIVQFVKVLFLNTNIAGVTLVPNISTFFVFYFALLCASAVGYFISTLFNLSKVLTVISGLLFIYYSPYFLEDVFGWLVGDNYGVLILNAFVIASVLYALAMLINSRQEVRRG